MATSSLVVHCGSASSAGVGEESPMTAEELTGLLGTQVREIKI
jgi:hypothetical protein